MVDEGGREGGREAVTHQRGEGERPYRPREGERPLQPADDGDQTQQEVPLTTLRPVPPGPRPRGEGGPWCF